SSPGGGSWFVCGERRSVHKPMLRAGWRWRRRLPSERTPRTVLSSHFPGSGTALSRKPSAASPPRLPGNHQRHAQPKWFRGWRMSNNDKPLLEPGAPVDCYILQTGNPDRQAYFYPAMYQLCIREGGAEEKVDLRYSGSRLLERLLQTPGELVYRDELLAHAWTGRVVSQGSLNQQIYTLRQVLGDEKQ